MGSGKMSEVRSIALVGVLILSACGSPLAGGSPSIAPTSPSAAPATGALPGSAVRISVNGARYEQGVELPLTPTGGPVVIVMAFPFPVDRASLDLSADSSYGFGTPTPFRRWLADGRLAFY
jgi:hypothetical protein